jgi:hypothetical protein
MAVLFLMLFSAVASLLEYVRDFEELMLKQESLVMGGTTSYRCCWPDTHITAPSQMNTDLQFAAKLREQ